MRGSREWIAKLARWLPYHEDRYFLRLQEAVHGQYRPRFVPDADTADPASVRETANRELDAFSDRADAAMRAYQQRKGMRGR